MKNTDNKNRDITTWKSDFKKEPLTSLNNLLMRRVYIGALNRNRLSEILFRIFNAGAKDLLDKTISEWLQKNWEKVPSSMPLSRWASILTEVFITIDRLKLNNSYGFAKTKYTEDRSWLKSLYKGTSNDPEGALLRMLARGQKDQNLMPLWLKILRMQENMPLDYSSIAILGLRAMPDKEGAPPGDISATVLKGFFYLADALKKNQPYNLKESKEFWTLKASSVMGLYPRTERYWINNFIPLAEAEPNNIAVKWLNSVLPNFSKSLNKQDNTKKSSLKEYPNKKETNRIINLLKREPRKTKQSDICFKIQSRKSSKMMLRNGYKYILGQKISRKETGSIRNQLEAQLKDPNFSGQEIATRLEQIRRQEIVYYNREKKALLTKKIFVPKNKSNKNHFLSVVKYSSNRLRSRAAY